MNRQIDIYIDRQIDGQIDKQQEEDQMHKWQDRKKADQKNKNNSF